jgi:succinate dehydrogenase hydrophobic anchor subunit
MSTQEHSSIPAAGANGFGQWAGLYVSGILLVVFVLAHILF